MSEIKTYSIKTLVNALAEIERLQGRCAELEAILESRPNIHDRDLAHEYAIWCDQLRFVESGAWLLLKQAEMLEECEADMLALPEYLNFTEAEMAGFKCGIEHVKGESQHLRQQAEEIEHGL